jgi:hypothetical protein
VKGARTRLRECFNFEDRAHDVRFPLHVRRGDRVILRDGTALVVGETMTLRNAAEVVAIRETGRHICWIERPTLFGRLLFGRRPRRIFGMVRAQSSAQSDEGF